jgi:hypothetical protein
MSFDFTRARPLLQEGNLPKLFREELGWEPAHQKLSLRDGDTDYAFTAIAEKRGFTVWLCESPNGGVPDHAARLKLDRQLSETSFEHLIVFVTAERTSQSWMWVRREQGKPLAARTHDYHRGQPGDSLLQKLESLYVSLEDEEAGLSTVEVAGRARAAFDIEKVTKAFYRDFDTHRKAFLKFIVGIGDMADREWYASVMLNRLMFVYFIQKKGFLDGDRDYLRQRLNRCKKEQGKDKFYNFYRYFLLRLFHEGFGKRRADRSPDLEKLLGNIPYLNGGLFDVHQLELPERYGKSISISDNAFEAIFEYFDKYQWHLDERPLRGDNEINPDVLGYIFEKYINQKQMGAYYTKEDITEYISKNTVIPFLFDAARAKCKVAFENPGGSTVWDLLRENPDRYIYSAVRHGTERELPVAIAAGLDTAKPNLIERRKPWNKPAPSDFGLPTEIWREVVARRLRYEELRSKLAAGEVREVNDFVTLNLDLRQFAQDVILNSEGPDLLRAVWGAIQKVTVLDPTCGSGAFLFAALNILEPLYEICLDRMEAFVADDDRDRPKSPEDSVRELIASGESQTLELKATARWNVRESKADKAMEQVIVKTVAAFLNSDGGNLLVGVQDDGSISGIEPDHKVVGAEKRNRDFYERWLNDLLLRHCGKEHTANLRISFVRFEEMDVCRIDVSRASTAVYIRENDQDRFYVRTGNSTNALTTSEAVAYHQQRFTNATPLPKEVAQSKPSRPKKYADFRRDIERVSAHPKRSYFVYKSIILNNLFGVDVMEEAVEICKLRLFLKLAAQVEPDATRDNLGIEPLPDIDFNIRAGNTLVGYANFDEVKRAVASSLDLDNAMDEIAVKAADLQQTFDKFRQLQTDGDGSVPAAHKLELQRRLKALEDELNRQLAGEYGVKVRDEAAFAHWVKSHQPFHWFIQFYGILDSGGFDVIIGNPPYLDLKQLEGYVPRNYSTLRTKNLYSLVLERCEKLVNGRQGYIVPISSTATEGYSELQKILLTRELWFTSFDDRPAHLFDGLDKNTLSILLLSNKRSQPVILSSRLNRWNAEEREALFSKLQLNASPRCSLPGCFPRISSKQELGIWEKLFARPVKLASAFSAYGRATTYYSRKVNSFLQILDFVPEVRDGRGNLRPPSEFKELKFAEASHAAAAFCLFNSTLFRWFMDVVSDGSHLNRREIDLFPFDPRTANKYLDEFSRLGKMLSADLKKHSFTRTMTYSHDTLTVQCIIPKFSKSILDEIDTVLAEHYEFTAEELDFILNYDIKYRLGRGTETDDE